MLGGICAGFGVVAERLVAWPRRDQAGRSVDPLDLADLVALLLLEGGREHRRGRDDHRRKGIRVNFPEALGWYRRRVGARTKAGAAGCADPMATPTQRAEIVTRAPILRSLRRGVPAVARSSAVPASARRCAAMRMEAKAEEPELVGGEAGGGGPVGEQVERLLLEMAFPALRRQYQREAPDPLSHQGPNHVLRQARRARPWSGRPPGRTARSSGRARAAAALQGLTSYTSTYSRPSSSLRSTATRPCAMSSNS